MTPPAARWALAVALLMTLLVHLVLVLLDAMPVMSGGAVVRHSDPDSYTRLLRVLQWYQQGGWFDSHLRALAPPEGVPLHWTRPLDLVLLAVAWPMSVLTDMRYALFAWGLVIAPLAHLLGVGLLWWGTRCFLGTPAFLLLATLLLMQRTVTWAVGAGRADHHLLHVLGTLALLALLLRHAGDPRSRWKPAVAGMVAGLALWSGSDGIMVVAIGAVALGALWVVSGEAAAGALRRYCVAVAGVLIVALMVERPLADWLSVEYDRLSLVHAALGLGMAATAVVLAWLPRAPPGAAGVLIRALAAMLVGGTVLVWLVLAFPGLVSHPYANLPEVVHRYLLSRITAENSWRLDSPLAVFDVILDFGAVPVAVGYVLFGPWRSAAARPRLLIYAAALAVTLPYGLAVARGSLFLQMVAVIPVAEAVALLAARSRAAFASQGSVRGASLATAALLAATWSPLTAGLVMANWFPNATLAARPRCDYGEVLPYIAASGAAARGAGILSDLFDGPELAWRTGLPAMVGPYHRGEAGIRDYETVLMALAPDGAAREVVTRRDVGLMLFCRSVGPGMQQFFRANPERLVTRLFTLRPPPWLAEVPLPADLRARFVLYQTVAPR